MRRVRHLLKWRATIPLFLITFFCFLKIMQKIALISFTMCIYPNLHAWWCIAVFYKNTKKVYFIKVARESLTSVWRLLFSLIIVHVLDMIHTYMYSSMCNLNSQTKVIILYLYRMEYVCRLLLELMYSGYLFFFHPLHRCTTALWVFFFVGQVILIYLQPCCVD